MRCPAKGFPPSTRPTEKLIGEAPKCGPADAARAVEGAVKAFERWRRVPAPKRGEILFQVAQKLVLEKERLARLMTHEMGKVLPEARGDVQEAIDMAFYMAGEGRRLFGYTSPVELPDKFGMAVRDPVGVVAAITPWNFPIAIPGWKIFPALIAGNAVIFKPASDTAILGIEFVRAVRGSRAAGRRTQRHHRTGRHGGRGVDQPSGRQSRHLHRLDRGRAARVGAGGAGLEEGQPGIGRQERRSR